MLQNASKFRFFQINDILVYIRRGRSDVEFYGNIGMYAANSISISPAPALYLQCTSRGSGGMATSSQSDQRLEIY